jgi:hypothetical protein
VLHNLVIDGIRALKRRPRELELTLPANPYTKG